MSTPLHRPFKSVLVANRGEIALRIVREAKRHGLHTVAVFSDPDAHAPHVEAADEAVRIGGDPAVVYLNSRELIGAAKRRGIEALHPGYGFLSENARFAEDVIGAGLVWIGPSPGAMRAMGHKGNAKAIARKADLPLIDGYDGEDQSDARLQAEANRLGYPVMIKAANGGGGRGMRRVVEAAAFLDALHAAQREARAAFGPGSMILERALDRVHHVEIQIFGDAHGNYVALGERDCSVQRRNQKIVEEAPSPLLTPELRARMSDAAIRLARAVEYVNAGTVEFLVDESRNFYFLEMNTRLQVEHPVTESVVGRDLIGIQLEIAAGRPLPLAQSDVKIGGHAIELRLCAEDPGDEFRPQSGRIVAFGAPRSGRIDAGIARGTAVPPDYDSMMAKLIAHAPTREEARRKALDMLRETTVLGVKTNKSFLAAILDDPDFIAGRADTALLSRRAPFAEDALGSDLAAIAALVLARGAGKAWRSTGAPRTHVILRLRAQTKLVTVEGNACGGLRLIDAHEDAVRGYLRLTLDRDGAESRAAAAIFDGKIHVDHDGRDALFEDVTYAPAEPKGAGGTNLVRAPMAGKIVRVTAEPGAQVEKGQVLVILEAMKMEHEIVARAAGTILSVAVKPGDQATNRQVLITLSPEP